MSEMNAGPDLSMLDDLLSGMVITHGKVTLSRWEATFLDSLNQQRDKRLFSEKQRAVLAKIHGKVFGEG